MAINVQNVERFKFIAHKIIPLVYDDSLSYYEFLCKVMQKLNEVISSLDNQNEILKTFDDEIIDWETSTDNKYNQFVNNINTLFEAFKQSEVEARTAFENSVNEQWDEFFNKYLETLGVEQNTGRSTTDVMSQKAVTDTFNNVIANEYSTSSTYASGDYCMKSGKLYICNTDISVPEAWIWGHWTEVNATDEINDVKGDLDILNQGGLVMKEDFISQQINEWLNEHPEATTTVQDGSITEEKFTNTLRKKKANYYTSVQKMKEDTSLIVDTVCVTLGYYEINDGGGATYRVRTKVASDVDDGGSIHFLNDTLVAELIVGDYVTPEQFGAYGDGVHDDTNAIQKAFSFIMGCNNSYISGCSNKEYIVGRGITKSVLNVTKPIKIHDLNLVDKRPETSTSTTLYGTIHITNVDGFCFYGSIRHIPDESNFDNGVIPDSARTNYYSHVGPAIMFVGDCGFADINLKTEYLRDGVCHGEWAGDGLNAIKKNGSFGNGLHDSNIVVDAKNTGYSVASFNMNRCKIKSHTEHFHRSVQLCVSDSVIDIVARDIDGPRSSVLICNSIILENGSYKTIGSSGNRVTYTDIGSTDHYSDKTIFSLSDIKYSLEGTAISGSCEIADNEINLYGCMYLIPNEGEHFSALNFVFFGISNQNTLISATINNYMRVVGNKCVYRIERNVGQDVSGMNTAGKIVLTINNKPNINISDLQTDFKVKSLGANDKITLKGDYKYGSILGLKGELYINTDYLNQIYKPSSATDETTGTIYIVGENFGIIDGTNLKIKYVGSTGTGGYNYLSGSYSTRPKNPQPGTIYYDKDHNYLVIYDGTNWLKINATIENEVIN